MAEPRMVVVDSNEKRSESEYTLKKKSEWFASEWDFW